MIARRNHCRRVVVGVGVATAVIWVAPVPTLATEHAHAESGHAEELHNIHAVGLFLGATTKFKSKVKEETSFTLAGEYEYQPGKWQHRWGFAGAIELIFAHELEGLVLPLVYYHPAEEWFVRTGIGLEIGREEDAESASAHLLWRTGVGYIFPLRNFLLVPSFDLDLVRSDLSIAYGVVIAKEF